MNKHNDSTCNECGVYVPMHRYEKAKLCESCRTDKRSGNAELRNIFKEPVSYTHLTLPTTPYV